MIFADGMPSDGVDPTVACLALLGIILATLARRLAATRWLAFSIFLVPLLICLIYNKIIGKPEEPGTIPLWKLAGPLILICAIVVFVVPAKKAAPRIEDSSLN